LHCYEHSAYVYIHMPYYYSPQFTGVHAREGHESSLGPCPCLELPQGEVFVLLKCSLVTISHAISHCSIVHFCLLMFYCRPILFYHVYAFFLLLNSLHSKQLLNDCHDITRVFNL